MSVFNFGLNYLVPDSLTDKTSIKSGQNGQNKKTDKKFGQKGQKIRTERAFFGYNFLFMYRRRSEQNQAY